MISDTTTLSRSARTATGTRVSTTGRLFISVALILIFEGAIRKWVAESSTLVLILLRDLLASYTIVRAVTHGHFRRRPQLARPMLAWSCCVLGWGLLQLALGESSFAILLIGLRFWLLYFWFGLAAAAGMNERDYMAALRVLFACLLLMAPLAVLQHYSSLDAFVNKTLDADEDSVFTVVAGVVRTTGTFTFTAGFVVFINICSPFVLGAFGARKTKASHRLLALALFASLVVCGLVSGARTLVVNVGTMLILFLLGNLFFAPARRKGLALLAAFVALLVVGASVYFLQSAVQATQERFESAAQYEDFVARLISIFLGEDYVLDRATWLGEGIGIGSNLAQYVQFSGRAFSVFGETETARTLIEGGLAGGLFVLIKLIVIVAGMAIALQRSLRTRAAYPVLVWVAVALALTTWQVIGQLTANGFFGLLLALGLLCLRYPRLGLFD